MEKYSLSSAISECELKPVRGCHQKQIVTNSGKHTEKEPLDMGHEGGGSTLAQLLGKSVWRLLRQLKENYPVTYWIILEP